MQIFILVLQSKMMPLRDLPEEQHDASEIQILTEQTHRSTTEYLGSGITEKGLCKAVVLHVIVDQHLLASIEAAAMQFDKVVMGYVGYDTQLIQELLCSLPRL